MKMTQALLLLTPEWAVKAARANSGLHDQEQLGILFEHETKLRWLANSRTLDVGSRVAADIRTFRQSHPCGHGERDSSGVEQR